MDLIFENGRTYEFRLLNDVYVEGIVDPRDTIWAGSGHPMVLALKVLNVSGRVYVPWHSVVTYIKE
jgi:hypothetical protein